MIISLISTSLAYIFGAIETSQLNFFNLDHMLRLHNETLACCNVKLNSLKVRDGSSGIMLQPSSFYIKLVNLQVKIRLDTKSRRKTWSMLVVDPCMEHVHIYNARIWHHTMNSMHTGKMAILVMGFNLSHMQPFQNEQTL